MSQPAAQALAAPAVCKTLQFSQNNPGQGFSRRYHLQIIFAKLEGKMAVLGYARVSTQDQQLTGQLEALKAAGATTIYREKVSGVRADRPQLAKLMAALKPSDVVLVTKLDRLGRRSE